MKTRILLATISAAALAAITINANAGAAYLTPRAAGNQIKHVSGIANDPNLVNTTGIVVVSPRAQGNQIKTVASGANEVTPAMACVSMMSGNPKSIQACAEHPGTMPGCNPVADASAKITGQSSSTGLSRPEKNGKLWAADKTSAALDPMKQENINPDPNDAKLGTLLRASRVAPALPPRFQEGVWRRIEEAECAGHSTGGIAWLDALAALVLRPRFALATATVLIVAGALLGVREGSQMAKQDAQARYLAAVAPHSLR